jgi:adenylate cyclase
VLEKADGSVYGDGVNIAARLQALCEPGGVMVSQAVHGAVASRIRGGFDDAGEQAMKNIPIRCARFGCAPRPAVPLTASAATQCCRKSANSSSTANPLRSANTPSTCFLR